MTDEMREQAKQIAEQAENTVRTLVRELIELNAWEQNGLSRDELVQMLDEALAE